MLLLILHIGFSEAGKVVWYSHLLKNFPQCVLIYTINCYSIVNEAEVDVFLEFPCFFYDPSDVGNLTFGSSAFSKSSLYIWKFSVHILLNRLYFYFISTFRICDVKFFCLWKLFSLSQDWETLISGNVAPASKFDCTCLMFSVDTISWGWSHDAILVMTVSLRKPTLFSVWNSS